METPQEYLSIILPETLYIRPEDIQSEESIPAENSYQAPEVEVKTSTVQETPTPPTTPKPATKELLLLVEGSKSILQDEAKNTFIHKFQQALKVEQDQLELIFTQEISESVEVLLQEKPFRKVISFGYEWQGVEKYSISKLEGKEWIVTDHLNTLVPNPELKGKLWKQCISLFQLK